MDQNSSPGVKGINAFVDRFVRQSLTKSMLLILADKEIVADLQNSQDLSTYLEFLADKPRNWIEQLFFILPKEDQQTVWTKIKGVK